MKGSCRYCIVNILILFLSSSAFYCYGQTLIPTFNCVGVYWSPPAGATSIECQVRYRMSGDEEWRSALPLYFDEEVKEYRGSIVNLVPGRTYEVNLILNGTNIQETVSITTWAEEFPVADTVFLPAFSDEVLSVNRSGTPNGYILYTYENGTNATIKVSELDPYGIRIEENTSYVILRGLTVIGPGEHGIKIFNNSHDVVIEHCDITNWGTNHNDGWGMNLHSAIYSNQAPDIERLIIQYNRFHHPRTDANSWAERRSNGQYHPAGPQAVSLWNTNGNHVIRYNEVFSDDAHYFNDGFGAGDNKSFRGFPNKDSDIYGNFIQRCWDDGIESEGANNNVRIWGNYIDKTFTKIAIASTTIGPLYIWRNIVNESKRNGPETNSDLWEQGPFLKAGSDTVILPFKRTYVFHNTVLQPEGTTGTSRPTGSNQSISSSGGAILNLISRNNIFVSRSAGAVMEAGIESCTNSWDYDLYRGGVEQSCDTMLHEINGIDLGRELPQYDVNNQPGMFALASGAPGESAGVIIPNFNDNFNNIAPDMGAFERGSSPIKVGVSGDLLNAGNNEIITNLPDFESQNVEIISYPNPVIDHATIQFKNSQNQAQVKLRIIGIRGDIQMELAIDQLQKGSHQIEWKVPEKLRGGVYIVKLDLGSESFYRKIVLIR